MNEHTLKLTVALAILSGRKIIRKSDEQSNNLWVIIFQPPFYIRPKPAHHRDFTDESDNVIKGLLTTLDEDLLLQCRPLSLRLTQNSLLLRIV